LYLPYYQLTITQEDLTDLQREAKTRKRGACHPAHDNILLEKQDHIRCYVVLTTEDVPVKVVDEAIKEVEGGREKIEARDGCVLGASEVQT
jgi:hypothetical protein